MGFVFSFSDFGARTGRTKYRQLQSADYLMFGRVTYEEMAAYWSNPDAAIAEHEVTKLMNSIPKIVFSTTLQFAEWNNSTLIRGNASDAIRQIKAEGGRDMYVLGSANLSETLINEDLFDEYRIGIAPVLLGNGRPLFKQGIQPKDLVLQSTKSLNTGGVILTYC